MKAKKKKTVSEYNPQLRKVQNVLIPLLIEAKNKAREFDFFQGMHSIDKALNEVGWQLADALERERKKK